MFTACGIDPMNKATKDVVESSPLRKVDARILKGIEANDILEGPVVLTPANIGAQLADPDTILLMVSSGHTRQHLLTSRSILKNLINMNDGENGVLFICKRVGALDVIHRAALRDVTPYFNLRRIGLTGFVRASQIQSIIRDPEKHQIYLLTPIYDAPSTAGWGLYKGIAAVSVARCQEGTGGIIYRIDVVSNEMRELEMFRQEQPNGQRVTGLSALGLQIRPRSVVKEFLVGHGGKRKTRRRKN
jgi:hypothetical protein